MKKLRILKSPWHLAHDHSLMSALADVADFDLLINYTRRWDENVRPLPANCKWVTHIEPGVYDLAILNVDQQCSQPGMNKAILPRHMRQAIEEIDPNIKICFINHGTPVYPELYQDANRTTNYVSEQLKSEILEIVKPYPMVVNSFQAQEEWGYGKAIIHGLDPEMYKPADIKEPRAISFVAKAGIGDKYYNRSFLEEVMTRLKEKHGIRLEWVNAPGFWQASSSKDYNDFVSRSLIYFNPTFGSPMPRSRSEAMLLGCCIITTPQHGGADYIKDGVNGFVVGHNEVDKAVEIIATLINNGYEQAIWMGKNARETAIKEFSIERYHNDWVNFLNDEVGIDMSQYGV